MEALKHAAEQARSGHGQVVAAIMTRDACMAWPRWWDSFHAANRAPIIEGQTGRLFGDVNKKCCASKSGSND
jgi:hypothetical protein